MVELLRVHVKKVCVALQLVNASNRVHVLQPRDLDVLLQRLNECELVEITSRDDASVLVLVEDLLWKMLADGSCPMLRR